MEVSLEEIVQVFSEEDKEYNRIMVEKGNEASGIIRGNLHLGGLGGKIVREAAFNESAAGDYNIINEVVIQYWGK